MEQDPKSALQQVSPQQGRISIRSVSIDGAATSSTEMAPRNDASLEQRTSAPVADGTHGGDAAGSARCLAVCRTHFCRRPSKQQLTAGLLFFLAFGGLIVLTATGDLRRFMDELRTLGWGADALLVLLFIYTGLPFGYGYTVVAVCTGYVSGWRGILTGWTGVALAVAIGVLMSRHWMRSSVESKLDSLPEAWSRPVRLLSADLTNSAKGFIGVDVLLRNSGVIPFGTSNMFVGAVTQVPIHLAVFSAMLAQMHGIVLNVNIGRALYLSSHHNGTSSDHEDEEEEGGGAANLITQIVISVTIGFVVSYVARGRLQKLTEAAEAQGAPGSQSSTSMDCSQPRGTSTSEGPLAYYTRAGQLAAAQAVGGTSGSATAGGAVYRSVIPDSPESVSSCAA